MIYFVYLSAATCVLEVRVESEEAPEWPRAEAGLVKLGPSHFRYQNVIAVVPADLHRAHTTLGAPK